MYQLWAFSGLTCQRARCVHGARVFLARGDHWVRYLFALWIKHFLCWLCFHEHHWVLNRIVCRCCVATSVALTQTGVMCRSFASTAVKITISAHHHKGRVHLLTFWPGSVPALVHFILRWDGGTARHRHRCLLRGILWLLLLLDAERGTKIVVATDSILSRETIWTTATICFLDVSWNTIVKWMMLTCLYHLCLGHANLITCAYCEVESPFACIFRWISRRESSTSRNLRDTNAVRHHWICSCMAHHSVLLLVHLLLISTGRDKVIWSNELGLVSGFATCLCRRTRDYSRVAQCWCPCVGAITLLGASHLLFEIVWCSSAMVSLAWVACRLGMNDGRSSWIDWTDEVLRAQVRWDTLVLMMLFDGSNCSSILF